jgi:hypothetical protein
VYRPFRREENLKRRTLTLAILAILGPNCGLAQAVDPVFSGPQVGEPLTPFIVRGVFDADAGKAIDLITRANGKPVFVVFVHESNRPSIMVTRVLMNYAARRAKDGLVAGAVWLGDDASSTEQFLKRARHALPDGVPIGISVDGKEGPGAYGLNRNVTMTVLVGKENKVTANFALVQPSVQADVPKILAQLVKLIGGKVPPVEELNAPPMSAMKGRSDASETDPKLSELLRGLIRQNAGSADVDRAAAAVETYVENRESARAEVGKIARRIIDSGALSKYGTPAAQEYLRKWAERFGPKSDKRADGKKPDR